MPMWAWDTAAMLRKLALGPAWDVTIPLFAPTMSPCKLQLMVRGRSPLVTMQETWTKSPSSKISLPKLKGRISGASAIIKENNRALTFCSTFWKDPPRTLYSAPPFSQFLLTSLSTINFQFCCVWGVSSFIDCFACIVANMLVGHTWNHQDTCSRSQISCCYSKIWGQVVTMERPRESQGFVSLCHNTRQLSKWAFICNSVAKTEWQHSRKFWKMSKDWKLSNFKI